MIGLQQQSLISIFLLLVGCSDQAEEYAIEICTCMDNAYNLADSLKQKDDTPQQTIPQTIDLIDRVKTGCKMGVEIGCQLQKNEEDALKLKMQNIEILSNKINGCFALVGEKRKELKDKGLDVALRFVAKLKENCKEDPLKHNYLLTLKHERWFEKLNWDLLFKD